MGKGQPNVYTCDTCHGETVTVDADNGVTPFLVNCRATPHCRGEARSAFYRVPPERAAEARLVWYRPETMKGLSASEREHVRQGGLLLRVRGHNEVF